MKKIRMTTVLLAVLVLILPMAISMSAPSPSVTISAGRIVSEGGESVSVPVYISGNTGICGAVLSIEYDSALVLEEIKDGDALSSLVMTKPGKLTDNPVKIIWDGVEADASNGVIAELTFTVPDRVGTYDINLSVEDGDIVDGDINPVGFKLTDGSISVNLSSVQIEIGSKKVTVDAYDPENNGGYIFVAFYTDDGTMTSVQIHRPDKPTIQADVDKTADYVRIMWLESNLQPLCETKKINL